MPRSENHFDLSPLGITGSESASSLLKYDQSLSGKISLVLSSLLLHLLSLALPLTMMQVYDRILLNASYNTLSWLVLGCTIAIILEAILKYSRTRLGSLLASRFEYKSSNKILAHLLKSPLDSFEKVSPSVHLERFQAIQTLKNFYSGQLYQVMLDLPFALLFMVVIYHLGGWVVVVPFMSGLCYIGFVFYCRAQFDRENSQELDAKQGHQSFLIQLLDRFSTVKAMNIEEQMLRRYEKLQFSKIMSSSASSSWAERPGLLGPTFSQFTMFGTIICCAHLVISGQMTMGGLTACMMLSSRALQPLQQSASFWIKLPAVRQAKEQIQLIADTKDHEDVCQIGDKALYNKDGEKKEAEILEPNDFEGDIQLKNLHFRYSLEDDWVLNDINLKVPAKTMVGITGPSKNGSTTMLMNLLGLLSPTQGQVLIDGMNMKDISEKSWRGKIEYLPRNGVLFKGSILDNLTSFRPHRQTIALDIASMIGLDPLVAGLTHGYETQVDSRSKISKDIIHRISMARCIITRPRILLIDKATASMDGPSEQIFLELLDKLQHSTTIILITQWPYLLGLCDQVFELKHGNMEPMKAKPARGEAVT